MTDFNERLAECLRAELTEIDYAINTHDDELAGLYEKRAEVVRSLAEIERKGVDDN